MNPFSNENKNVFILTMPSEVDKGALCSRYSRSPNSLRQTYHNEFENNPNRGKEFYDRILATYGDDSIQELGATHLAIEKISNIAAQAIEDSRIGLSYLEQSSRYVKLNTFYTPNIDKFIDIYNEQCQHSINTYNKISEEITTYLKEKFPEESLEYGNAKNPQSIYNNTIKGKTLDIIRGLLPVSIHTNLGVIGNARAFEYLILKMKANKLQEIRELANDIYSELNTVIEPFLTRINTDYGKKHIDYINIINSKTEKMLKKHLLEINEPTISSIKKDSKHFNNYVKCLESDVQLISEVNILTSMFFEQSDKNISFNAIKEWILKLTINQRRKMLEQLMNNTRTNRRHRLPRAFENSMWRFEIVSSYAVYRDLHRHRLLTFHRQKFNPHLGYYIPKEINEIGRTKEFTDVLEGSKTLYHIIYEKYPEEAQYVLNFAFNYRYQIYANLRELCHIIELRTVPQGSPEYRLICQRIFNEIKKRGKFLTKFINFVDLNDYPLERLKSEIRTDIRVNR